MSRVSSISELNDSTNRWRILVRADRKWNVYHKTLPNEVFCITMVLVDKEGHKIRARVLVKSLLDQYRETPIERETYFIANFVLSTNTNMYRATTHPFKINFRQQTYIMGQALNIYVHCYSFFPIVDIMKVDENVYGFVKCMEQLEEYCKDNETKHKLHMVITDKELKVNYTMVDHTGKTFVVFWDQLALQLLEKSAAELKVILPKERRSYDFLDQLDNIIGKKMLLKLKINAYNKKYPNSSISVP
ncbi:uncharacterized protein LOC129286264 [Prosopis cineraria]|uniref:uncharacterized protein LOC129286264 n=1 Tax=Prosopis cineraria TaxID=364024 RepID=UPI002410065D|nr:uncharacterized protein LOC129286264 [Prosopis cineraria]